MRGARILTGIGLALVLVAGAGFFIAGPSGYDRNDQSVIVQPRSEAQGQRSREAQILTSFAGGGIGVQIRDLNKDELAKQASGVVVTSVNDDSPAAQAGVKSGDVVIEFDGERVRSAAQLSRLVRETPPGRSARLVAMREGKRVDLSVTPRENAGTFIFDAPSGHFQFDQPLGRFQLDDQWRRDLERQLRESIPRNLYRYEAPAPQPPGARPRQAPPFAPPLFGGRGQLGVTLQELTDQLADYFGTKDGVLVSSVADGSPAQKAGMKAGDIITTVDGRNVASSSELTRELRNKRAGNEVTLGIVRDRKPMTLKVPLEDPQSAIRPRWTV
jgi:C-terminal processing protease CtpA/Prc